MKSDEIGEKGRTWRLLGALVAAAALSTATLLFVGPFAGAEQHGNITGTDCGFWADTPHISTHFKEGDRVNSVAHIKCDTPKKRIWVKAELQRRPPMMSGWEFVAEHQYNKTSGKNMSYANSYAYRDCNGSTRWTYRMVATGSVVTRDGREYLKRKRYSYERVLYCGPPLGGWGARTHRWSTVR